MLLKDMHGRNTVDKADGGNAVKQYMAVRGRGQLMSYADLVNRARSRRRSDIGGKLDCYAVVGAIDLKRRGTVVKCGKSHGPANLPSDVTKAATAEIVRLIDPIAIEATLAADVPIDWQGGDNCMLDKGGLVDAQALDNQRSIMLANQEPKLAGGELRSRLAPQLKTRLVGTQWGDGFGASSCELAHLALGNVGAMGISVGQCLLRLFVDVVQAFPWIVVELSLPLPDRSEDTRTLLKEAGFADLDIDAIKAGHVDAVEWSGSSEHFHRVMAQFQEDQWMSCDHAAGIMAAFIGTAAGLPLAGIIAAIALSKVSRSIQDRLQRLGLVARIPTVDAKAAMGPQSLLEWAVHADVSNFGYSRRRRVR